jgi:hypothetical protein
VQHTNRCSITARRPSACCHCAPFTPALTAALKAMTSSPRPDCCINAKGPRPKCSIPTAAAVLHGDQVLAAIACPSHQHSRQAESEDIEHETRLLHQRHGTGAQVQHTNCCSLTARRPSACCHCAPLYTGTHSRAESDDLEHETGLLHQRQRTKAQVPQPSQIPSWQQAWPSQPQACTHVPGKKPGCPEARHS